MQLFNFDTRTLEDSPDDDENLDAFRPFLPHGKVRRVYDLLIEVGTHPVQAFLALLELCDVVASRTESTEYLDLVVEIDRVATGTLEMLENSVRERNALWNIH